MATKQDRKQNEFNATVAGLDLSGANYQVIRRTHGSLALINKEADACCKWATVVLLKPPMSNKTDRFVFFDADGAMLGVYQTDDGGFFVPAYEVI